MNPVKMNLQNKEKSTFLPRICYKMILYLIFISLLLDNYAFSEADTGISVGGSQI